MWPINLSVRLPIAGLVGHYLTNYLIGREPILKRIAPLISLPCGKDILCGISVGFPTLSPSSRQVAHVLLTRPPLSGTSAKPLDLHVLGAPPAFVLSQDQTLNQWYIKPEGLKSFRLSIWNALFRILAFMQNNLSTVLPLVYFLNASRRIRLEYQGLFFFMLFNFQGSFSLRRLFCSLLTCSAFAFSRHPRFSRFWLSYAVFGAPSLRRLIYNTTRSPLCQHLISGFSIFFLLQLYERTVRRWWGWIWRG